MKKLLRIILPLLTVGIGVAVFAGFLATKPKAEKQRRKEQATLVETTVPSGANEALRLNMRGVARASEQITVIPQVAGRVLWLNDKLVPGGFVAKGEELVRIDPTDYKNQLQAQASQVEQAKLALEMEKGRQVIAKQEWELFGKETDDATADLALRRPHLRQANAGVVSARSMASQSRVNLSRTKLSAPFNAAILSENVDLGQLVFQQSQVATLVGTDTAWVQTSVPVKDLQWFDVPGVGGAREGSKAIVSFEMGDKRAEIEGKVVRLLPDLDSSGVMARVIIEVEDPFGLKRELPVPLLINSQVRVTILGRTLSEGLTVPRTAIHNGNKVWILTPESRLRIVEVELPWKGREIAVVKGLSLKDKIITSAIPSPIEGMLLAAADDEKAMGSASKDAKPEPSGGKK